MQADALPGLAVTLLLLLLPVLLRLFRWLIAYLDGLRRGGSLDDDDLLPAFDYQVAGHMGLSNEGGSLLVPEPGRIAKPVGLGYFAGEDRFYQTLRDTPELAAFCPAFYGHRSIRGRRFVVLEDLTHGMREPCIVDIKLGTTTVAPEAAWSKRITHLAKDRETTTRSLGVRLIGAMHTGAGADGGPRLKLGKPWGKAIRPGGLTAALRSVFSNEGRLCRRALRHYVLCLDKLLRVLQSASSLAAVSGVSSHLWP